MKSKQSLSKLVLVVVIIFVIMFIGYFGFNLFSEKAENSKALSELKQVQEVLMTNLMSTDNTPDRVITCDGIEFKYEMKKGKVVFSGSSISEDDGTTLTKELKEYIPELNELEGSYKWEDNIIIYTTSNGKGKAYWVSGELPSKSK